MEPKTFQDPPPLPEGGNAAHRAEWVRLEESLEYMECRNCHGDITVTSNDTIHEYRWPGTRCGCGRDKAVPVQRERYIKKREREMIMAQEQRLAERGEGSAMLVYDTIHGEVKLTVRGVRELVNPDVTELEAWAFMRICANDRLSPFADGEISLVKIKGQAAYVVRGKQAYVSRGSRHDEYLNHESGIIAADSEGGLVYRVDELLPPGYTLFGAWCRVKRRTQGEQYNAFMFDRIAKYKDGRLMAYWAKEPELMAHKTAVKRVFKEAFPDTFASWKGRDDDDDGSPVVEVAPPPVDPKQVAELKAADAHAGDSLFPQTCDDCGAEAKTDNAGVLSCANCGVIYDPHEPGDPHESHESPEQEQDSVATPENTGGLPLQTEGLPLQTEGAPVEQAPAPALPRNPKVGTPSSFWSGVSKIDMDGKGRPPSTLDVSHALGADPIVYMRDKDWGPENWDILADEVVELFKKRE